MSKKQLARVLGGAVDLSTFDYKTGLMQEKEKKEVEVKPLRKKGEKDVVSKDEATTTKDGKKEHSSDSVVD